MHGVYSVPRFQTHQTQTKMACNNQQQDSKPTSYWEIGHPWLPRAVWHHRRTKPPPSDGEANGRVTYASARWSVEPPLVDVESRLGRQAGRQADRLMMARRPIPARLAT
jgi:hypothetical protein